MLIMNFSQVLEESKKTAMWIAYDKDHQQILELLLSNPKVDVNVAANKNSQTLLTRNAENRNIDLVRKILQHPGVDVNKARLTYNVRENSREIIRIVRLHNFQKIYNMETLNIALPGRFNPVSVCISD